MAFDSSKPDALNGKNTSLAAESHARFDGLRSRSPAKNASTKEPSKPGNGHPYLDVPLQDAFRPSIDTLSVLSADSDNVRSTGRSMRPNLERIASRSPAPPRTWKDKWEVFWQRNKGLALVLLAQFFGGLMNVATRLLEISDANGEAMSPFQILLARMSITSTCCLLYMWWAKVEHGPFGKKDIRHLLVIRGLTGFLGVYGIYYSLIYLPIAEAVVITFLAPIIACWACSWLIHEPFLRMEQVAAFLSLVGVTMIAQPTSFLGWDSSPAPLTHIDGISGINSTASTVIANGKDDVTPAQRHMAIVVGLIGTCGAAGAYTTIRWIGRRAHPLISVNYFAVWCTLVSAVALAFPGVEFRLPSTVREWFLLVFLGVCGFVMQFLLTAGLQHEKSSRATQMVYTQMLFAIFFDKIIWNSTPGVWSIAGSSLILGSAVYVAVKGDAARAHAKAKIQAREEEEGLMESTEHGVGDELEGDGRGPLRGLQEVQLRTLRT